MALQKRGKWRYGDSQADIRAEIRRYSQKITYLAHHYADAVCGKCGGRVFWLFLDDLQGVAVRTCVACDDAHAIGDSDNFMASAELDECVCPCDGEQFEITVGVSLYKGSEDVKWLYLACRCPTCGLTAVYGDWKNEYIGYKELLARV
jgi:ribosomal protein S27AE